MSREHIVEAVLGQAQREEFDRDKLLHSFSSLVEHLETTRQHSGSRDAVCRAIIDGILPKLVLLESKDQEKLVSQCQFVLCQGDPEKVFHDLCLSLKKANVARPVNARFLLWFVSNSVERLVRVLGRLESQETVSFLIHMPSLISNGFGNHLDSGTYFFQERDYFTDLSKAICKVSTTSNHHSSGFVGSLVQRMVIIGKAEVLVSSCCTFEEGRYLVSVLQRAPHASIEALLRAALETEVCPSNSQREHMLTDALRSVVLANATAQQACLGKIPFSQFPLKRPRTSLYRLVDAIAEREDETIWKDAVISAANVWNSAEFTYCAELSLQRQVTRLLLYYLSARIRKKMYVRTQTEGLLLLFTSGIQLRLGENDPRLRRHAMVVAEAVSKAEDTKEKLSFPRDGIKEEIASNARFDSHTTGDEDSDSDFSLLAHDEGNGENADPDDTPISMGSSKVDGEDLYQTSSSDSVSAHFWANLKTSDNVWQFEDDWESVDSWEDEDASSDTQSAIVNLDSFKRNGIAFRMPISVHYLLSAMIDANKSPGGGLAVDAGTLMTTMDQITALPHSGLVYGETLRRAAVELCLEVCRVDVERYPDTQRENLTSSRRKALEKMICVDLQGCGHALIDRIICGPSSDVFKRIEALSSLTAAIRAASLSEAPTNQLVSLHSDGSNRRSNGKKAKIIEKKPMSGSTLIEKKSPGSANGLRTAGMIKVFHHLAQRMCEGGGAEFLHVESRDSQLWGHAIVALATMASCVGMCEEGVELRTTVIEISMRRVLRLEPDSIVRRAVILALIAVLRSMAGDEVTSFLVEGIAPDGYGLSPHNDTAELAGECFEFLTHSAEFDADLAVRRFAKQALGLWARRVEQLS